MNESALI